MSNYKKNPVFWLMWALPGAAVCASFVTLAIAMQDADRALPDIYHWEGERLDADFERARNAAKHGLRAALDLSGGVCTVTLTNAPVEAGALQLRLTNGNDANLDRAVRLSRVGESVYRAPCMSLPAGRWRVALQDEGNTWSLRAHIDGDIDFAELLARDPAGQAS